MKTVFPNLEYLVIYINLNVGNSVPVYAQNEKFSKVMQKINVKDCLTLVLMGKLSWLGLTAEIYFLFSAPAVMPPTFW